MLVLSEAHLDAGDNQKQATIVESDGLELNLLLASLKEESGLKAGCLEMAGEAIDPEDSKWTERMTDEIDSFKKIEGDWGMDLSYLTGKQVLRVFVSQFTGGPVTFGNGKQLLGKILIKILRKCIIIKNQTMTFNPGQILDGSEIMIVVVYGR